MNVGETKKREGLQGLIELAPRSVPDLRREAESLEPLRPRRGGTLLARARDVLDWRRLPGLRPREAARPQNGAVRLATRFAFFVLLPTLVVGLYLFLIAADQYVTEAKFAVRGNVEPMTDVVVGEYSSLFQKNNNQDSYIVKDFIQSRAMVEGAEESLDVSKMFSRSEADLWARFYGPAPIEDLVRYWRRHVQVRIDAISGVLSLSVRAFTPEDSLAISREIIKRSEILINDISRRAQGDTVAHAMRDATAAEERLKKSRLALQTFRNQWGIIDPVKSAEATLTTLGLLNKDKLKAENDLRVLRASNLDEKSRGIQVLAATVTAIDGQMKQLQDQLTTAGLAAGAENNLTQALLEFEGLKIEQTIAEKLNESANLLLNVARVASNKQHVYLATFVSPAMASDSLYPLRWSALFITFFCCLMVWSSISLVFSAVNDQRL